MGADVAYTANCDTSSYAYVGPIPSTSIYYRPTITAAGRRDTTFFTVKCQSSSLSDWCECDIMTAFESSRTVGFN